MNRTDILFPFFEGLRILTANSPLLLSTNVAIARSARKAETAANFALNRHVPRGGFDGLMRCG
jgi:hypothetical protein